MNRRLFVEFYKIGLETAKDPKSIPMLNKECEEVYGETSPNEYAFYFARLCMDDVKSRGRDEWQKMSWFQWRLYRLGYWISRLIPKRKKRQKSMAEQFTDSIKAVAEQLKGENHA